MRTKLARNIGLYEARSFGNKTLMQKAVELSTNKYANFRTSLQDYDPAAITYRTTNGRTLRGPDELLRFISNPSNHGIKVTVNFQKYFDIALEGGGAHGFGHLGVVHGMAIKGFGYDRISGTSAGSIAGAILAAGYEVDLNFKTNVDKKRKNRLNPSRLNSANQILFEDLFEPFTDFAQGKARLRQQILNCWLLDSIREIFNSFMRDVVTGKANELILDISVIENEISDNIIAKIRSFPGGNTILDFRPPIRGARTVRQNIRSAVNQLGNLFQTPIGVVRDFLVTVISRVRDLTASLITDAFVYWMFSDENLKLSRIGLFRLTEFGGFWDGIFIRDWLERHLQEKVTGTGALLDGSSDGNIPRPSLRLGKRGFKRAVTFKDLPIDLCITTSDVGIPGDDFDARNNTHLVYFSKKTSPDYPVAEAVRRSMSLPFVFVPRTIGDGYVDRATVTKTSDYNDVTTNAALAPIRVSRFVRGRNMCLDGGFFVNSPISVFRDKENEVFDCPVDSSGNFTKTLAISNLNAGLEACQRPYDIPVPKMPEPIKNIMNDPVIKLLQKIFSGPSRIQLEGLNKVILSALMVNNATPLGNWKEFEINLLLQLVPNSIYCETLLLDPFHFDVRLSANEFAMPKTTKKWLSKNGFEACRKALNEIEQDVPALSGLLSIPASFDPYLHLLRIENVRINDNSFSIVPPNPESARLDILVNGPNPAKIGDRIYHRSVLTVKNALHKNLPLMSYSKFSGSYRASNFVPETYTGFGYSWIKAENTIRNIRNRSDTWLSFDVNIPVKVTLLLDVKPGFADSLEFEEDEFVLEISDGTRMRTFSKLFDKGNIVLPGPRNINSVRNRKPLGILVRPV